MATPAILARVRNNGEPELGFRSLLTVRQDEEPQVVDAVTRQLWSWLRKKRYDADALRVDSEVDIGPDATASLHQVEDRDGSISMRARIVENKPNNGTWISEVTCHVPGRGSEPAFVLIDVSGPETPRAPGIAKLLTGDLPARDGTASLADAPIVLHPEDVEELGEAVCDPNRRGLLFVAGMSADVPYQHWREYVAGLLQDTAGLAAAYFLTSEATQAFAQVMGPSHAVSPGTVRTYYPDVDPASELDALRHKVLGTHRILADRRIRLARILGRSAQDEALRAELPAKVRRVQRRLGDHIDSLLIAPTVEASEPPGPPAPEVVSSPTDMPPAPSATLSLLEGLAARARTLIHQVLGVVEPEESHWQRLTDLAVRGRVAEQTQEKVAGQLSSLRDDVDDLREESARAQRRLEDEQLEHADTADNLSKAVQRTNQLEELLLRSELASEVFTEPPPAEDVPQDFEALLAALDDLEYVTFTGDADITTDLGQQDPLGRWAAKTWEIASALEDFGRAQATGLCSTSVDGYLQNVPDGCRGFSVNRHAYTESEDVQKNPKFRKARVLPVPTHVDRDGETEMMAHFKIAQSGMISPRLHYYDDTKKSGRIYVGYIGPHLPTKKTR